MLNRRYFLCAAPLALAACSTIGGIGDGDMGGVAPPAVRSYDVVSLSVTVPRTLVVSEQNAYYPSADIVWRGDPPGDRYVQIQSIFEDGMGRGVAALNGSRPVRVSVEVRRFHALTEKARYTIGGVHSIRFVLTVFDAQTGQVIEGPRLVSADLDALGGDQAIAAERAGRGERVQITNHLAIVAQQQLGDRAPAG